MEVNGIDMFSTIMKLVENNPEIRVTKSEMIIQPTKPRAVTTRNQTGEKFEDKYHSFLLTKYKGDEGKTIEITAEDARAWCEANDYKASSASSLTSLMVKRGFLAKTGTRGIFRLKWPS
jgi:hypothetical protein